MAIKGKSRSRGGRTKAVTPGPRPAYVPVKRPWWRKRGFWVGVLVVLLVASAAGIWYGVAKSMTKDREQALQQRMRQAGTQYKQLVEPLVSGLGEAIPPTGFNVFPKFSTTIDQFEKKAISAKDAQDAAKSTAVQAKLAYEKLNGIDAAAIVRDKGFQRDFVLFFINSKSKMITGLKLFEQAAQLVVQATQLEGDARDQLMADAKSIAGIAKATFDDGYADYVEVQAAAQVLVASGPIPPQVPGGAGP